MKCDSKGGCGKQWWKRICSAGLALMLAVGLCACGGSADLGAQTGSGADAADVPGKINANAALAKENVYRVNEIEIPKPADGESVSVESMARRDGRIYAAMGMSDWENGSKYFVFSMDESGNAPQTVFLELPENGEGEDAAAEPDPNIQEWKDVRYSDFVIGAEGRTYALRRYHYSYVNQLTDQSFDEQRQYVCCWGAEGTLLWQAEPCEDSREDLSVWALFPASDGSLELLLTGEDAYRISVEKDGSLSGSDKERLSEATVKALGNCRRLLRKEDGSCLLLCRDAAGGLSLMKYDLQTDVLGESFQLPDDLPATSLSDTVFASGAGSDLVYAGGAGVFTYDMGDAQVSPKMNYVNSDRNITDTSFLLELDETHFFLFYKEDYGNELKAGIFAYVEPKDIPDKAVVVLAGLAVNGGMKKRVIQYNRENERFRVVLKEYGACEDLNLDMASGHMPDILLAEGLPMRSYIAKGLIADVGALIDADGELSRTDFMENVFDAYSVDGKWMYVIPSFTLFTMAAKSSHVGDGNGWTIFRRRTSVS